MKRLVLAVPALVMLILAAPLTPAFGQAGGIDMEALDRLIEDHKQVPLTEDIINRFVASYPEMKAVGAKFPQTEATEDKAAKMATMNSPQCRRRSARPWKRSPPSMASRTSRNG